MKFWVYVLVSLGCIALSVWLTYIIGNSELPLWLKLLLLR